MSDPSHRDDGGNRLSLAAHAPAAARATTLPRIELAIDDELVAVEREWRRFERSADCTVFQAFDWLATWHRHVGRRNGVTPAIVTGRRGDGGLLFLLPLAVLPGTVRRLTWLGSELCDYNAPLIDSDFTDLVTPERFRRLWRDVRNLLERAPHHRYDLVELTKMPETVGAQRNPLLALGVGLNPSGAHLADLHDTWDDFYQAKRSSVTRARDRNKYKRLGKMGELSFVTPAEPAEIARTLDILFAQKTKAFARMGVGNIFARPGHRDFFLDIATHPSTRHLTHVSRLDVGAIPAAVNLGLTFRGVYYHVLCSYDDGEVARFGPGSAHLRDLLGYAIGLGCRHFDFTIGDEPYKFEWSDRKVALYDHVAAATPRGWPSAALMLARRRLARLIKQNRLFWTLFSRIRSAIGARSQGASRSSRQRLDTGDC